MQSFKQTVVTILMLDASINWENQLKDLKETFTDFYLLKYKNKEVMGYRYNTFKFTHEICINCNYS